MGNAIIYPFNPKFITQYEQLSSMGDVTHDLIDAMGIGDESTLRNVDSLLKPDDDIETAEIEDRADEIVKELSSGNYWGPKIDSYVRGISRAVIIANSQNDTEIDNGHSDNGIGLFGWLNYIFRGWGINHLTAQIDNHDDLSEMLCRYDSEETTSAQRKVFEWVKNNYTAEIAGGTESVDGFDTVANVLASTTSLTDRQAQAFAGVVVAGRSPEDVSEAVGVSTSRIYEARKTAEQKLTEQFIQSGTLSNYSQGTVMSRNILDQHDEE